MGGVDLENANAGGCKGVEAAMPMGRYKRRDTVALELAELPILTFGTR